MKIDLNKFEQPTSNWCGRSKEETKMGVCIQVVQNQCGSLTGEVDLDVPLLREQRDALLTSIDDAEDFIQYGNGETREHREKQIQLLDGLINMLDDILDSAK